MTNQIKYLLAPLALSVLVGCGKPEANSEEKTLEEQCEAYYSGCLLYTSPSPRDLSTSRMPSSA